MRATRAAALLAAAALVAAGCEGGAMTTYRFSKDAESLQSLATEGGLLADGVADGRVTSAFAMTHAQELASDTEKLATVVASTEPVAGLRRKTDHLAALARAVANRLRALADRPSDGRAARRIEAALNDAADTAEQLEKSL